jgi:hypothetical protein
MKPDPREVSSYEGKITMHANLTVFLVIPQGG